MLKTTKNNWGSKMDNITKILSNKIIVIVTTLTLTLAYVGIAKVYAEGLVNNLNSLNKITENYGRNTANNFDDLIKQANAENIHKIKYDLEKQLQQTNLILNIIEEQKHTSKHGIDG